jgi:DNA-binding MarR family transcriptional regulator
MPGELISADLQQFILKSIDSIAQLEALLLLAAGPNERWTVAVIAARLYISEPEATGLLDRLVAEGLIALEGEPAAFRYQPASAELDARVKALAEAYRTHLVPVTNLIHAKPRTRVQEFADAFKLRKDEVRKDEE